MSRRRWLLGSLALASGALASGAAQAFDWSVTAHVTMVEATYMPAQVTFLIDQAGGSCAAGQTLSWTAAGSDSTLLSANASAVFSLLMTAKVSGQAVTLFGSNSGCSIQFVHLGSI